MEVDDSGESGDKCVSAISRFSAESGLLRLELKFNGGGTDRKGLLADTDFPIGVDKAESYGISSNSSAWLCLFRLKILRMTVFKVLPVRRWARDCCEWDSIDGSAVSSLYPI